MSQFCCGCPLRFGVSLIVFCNLVQNLFYIATATSNIIFKVPTYGFNANLTTQTFNAAFCLLGLPFIASAVYGLIAKNESHLNLYLFYLICSFILDMIFIGHFFAFQDVCETLPGFLTRHGAAFACGFMRIFSIVFVLNFILIELYCIFAVWSLCADWAAGGGQGGLPDLYQSAAEQQKKKNKFLHKPEGNDIHGNSLAGGPNGFPAAYGSFPTAPGMGGGSQVFGGSFHETNFPPSAKFA